MKDYSFDLDSDNVLWVIFYDDKGNVQRKEPLTKDLFALLVQLDVDTGVMHERLQYFFRGREIIKDVELEKLQPNALISLINYGFPFSDSFVRKYVSAWLNEEKDYLPIVEVTKQLGWKTKEPPKDKTKGETKEETKDEAKDGTLYFQLSKSISRDKSINVTYNGELTIKKAGTWEEYKRFLKELILPHIQLQVIIAFSVASALATYLDDDQILTIHLRGETSTGKTTALKCGASVWSEAKRTKNGVLQTWNTTNAALINGLCGYVGITICLDEIGASDADKDSFLNLVYKLSMGMDKKRMNYESSDARFAVNILSSGEIPMKDIEDASGADVRMLEIDFPWTESKEHSEAIDFALRNCYGHFGEEFVKVLLTISKEKIQSLYDRLNDKITKRYTEKCSRMTEKGKRIFLRTLKKITVIALAAYIMHEKLNLDFQYIDIADFLINNSSLSDGLDDEAIRMIEDYMHYRKADLAHYDSLQRAQPTGKSLEDLISDTPFDEKYISIPKTSFYNVLFSCNYTLDQIVRNLQILRDRGILHCEAGKLYNRRKNGEKKLPYIELSIEKMDEEDIDYVTLRSPYATR